MFLKFMLKKTFDSNFECIFNNRYKIKKCNFLKTGQHNMNINAAVFN